MHKVTVRDVAEMKSRGEKIPMITAYDYTTAKVADQVGIPLLLVGDSLGMVVLGYESTVSVTMDDMLHHVKAVARGVENSMVIADLPFMAYQIDPSQALANAGRLIQEGGASSVKLEGGERMAETTRRIVECGIPVMGHIGLTPQSVNGLGGYRVQGRGREEAEQLLNDAVALEQAGAYAVVLEMVPAPLACVISKRLTIPTIGIGAGAGCDGQVQVIHDMLGLFTDFVPKHARQYAKLADTMTDALTRYAEDVRDGSFPSAKESFKMDEGLLEDLVYGS
jgi:3-methyl-2-oxobutanoate hydroxymethyltransferase